MAKKSEISPKKHKSNFPKKYSITFAHLDIQKGQLFIAFLKVIIPHIEFEVTSYRNSIEVFFRNDEDK